MTPPHPLKKLVSTSRHLSKLPAAPGRLVSAICAICGLLAACGGGGPTGTDPEPNPRPPLACLNLPAEITWHRSAAASADWNDVLIDSRNRLWLAGYADGVIGQDRTDPGGNSRAVVRQLSPDGLLLWDSAAQLDTPGTDVAEALALDAAGTVYAAGRTSGALGGNSNAGQFDTFVAWGQASAAPWRIFQAGNERPQHPRRLRIGTDGGLHLAGYDDDFVPSNYVAAWTDPFVMKLRRRDAGSANEGLMLQWSQQFATAEPDLVDGLAVDADGASYVSGVLASGAQRGIFVRKLDAQGMALWTARYTTQAVDNVAALVPMPDGSLLMAGSVYGSFRGAAAAGGQDIFVARISGADGRVLAHWQYGTPGSDWLADMVVDAQGRVILFGETDGSFVPGQAPAGLGDLFLLQLSPDGGVLARRQWGTAADERAQRIAVDSCGRVAAVGSSTANGIRAGLLWFWKP